MLSEFGAVSEGGVSGLNSKHTFLRHLMQDLQMWRKNPLKYSEKVSAEATCCPK